MMTLLGIVQPGNDRCFREGDSLEAARSLFGLEELRANHTACLHPPVYHAQKKPLRCGRGVRLIVFGEENGRLRPIPFRDDPKLDAIGGVVDREQAGTFRQGGVVRHAVFGTTIAPISLKMPGKGSRDLLMGDLLEGIGRDHKAAQIELRGAHRL